MKNKTMREQLRGEFYRNNKAVMCLAAVGSILSGTLGVIASWIVKLFIDTASGADGAVPLGRLIWFSSGFIIFALAANILDVFSQAKFVKRALVQYKEFAFGKMSEKSISAFRDEDPSAYLSALTNDISSIENDMLIQQFTLISRTVTFIAAIILMLYSSVQMTLIAAAGMMLPVISSVIVGGRLKSAEQRVSESNKDFTGVLNDCLNGFATMKSFRAEKAITRLFSGSCESLEKDKCTRIRLKTSMYRIGIVAGMFSQFLVFVAGTYIVLTKHTITAGTVMMFLNLMGNLIYPMTELPALIASRKAAAALTNKLADALEKNTPSSGSEKLGPLKRGIKLDNVSFGYDADKEVLHDISVEFEAGKAYAVVGGSGSGKSTLLELLMAGGNGYSGKILFDGRELSTAEAGSVYDLISVIQQKVFVFNASIKDNITMFGDFARETFENAVKSAHLDKLIKQSGEGHLCGRDGSSLSGGEKQRISIARSLLKKSSVLLADEATAALDPKTAYQVSGEILDLKGITRIVVTHSLEKALLRRYDGILVMKDGRIAEQGSFDELMQKKGYFYALYTVEQ